MYSTMALSKHSKASGKLAGTHQQLDCVARKIIARAYPAQSKKFPTTKQILHFEGTNGPDALKTKSAGVDEPMHFIIPGSDDGKLIQMIRDHHYNLKHALEIDDTIRAAFEAAWLAHAITDGLTPAHHFPLQEVQNQLMTEKEFIKVFGVPMKGLMHGRNMKETLKNNWLYWAKDGYMTKHLAFEYGVILVLTTMTPRALVPKISAKEYAEKDIDKIFYTALEKIANLDMYTEFCEFGWTLKIHKQTREILLPEIVKTIALAWSAAL